MSMRLAGRTALVTGSSQGIGKAIALRLAEDGAKVIVHARSAAKAEPVAGQIRAAGGSAAVVLGDFAEGDTASRVVQDAFAVHGGLDILVLNAGGGSQGLAVDLPVETIDRTLAFNLRATILAVAEYARLTQSPHGRIVFISSGMATHPAPGVSVGAAAKAGHLQFGRTRLHAHRDDRRPDLARPGSALDRARQARRARGHRRRRRLPRQRRGALADRAHHRRERRPRHHGGQYSCARQIGGVSFPAKSREEAIMPKETYRGAIFRGPGSVEVVDLPYPACGDGDVIVRNLMTGVCGSDVSAYRHGGDAHMIWQDHEFGHEAVSEIVEMGRNVRGLALGDHVFVNQGKALRDMNRMATVGGFSEFIRIPQCEAGESVL
ncbi:MAG: SDR family NAD(P)-dependent oxidoreductase, partial [Sphingomonadales bacterium]|nr:SDR family NAD(P)-dependent oxidoreductase [Sphingomonadales bacterium]